MVYTYIAYILCGKVNVEFDKLPNCLSRFLRARDLYRASSGELIRSAMIAISDVDKRPRDKFSRDKASALRVG